MVFQQFSPRSGEFFQHFIQQFSPKNIFLAICFQHFSPRKNEKVVFSNFGEIYVQHFFFSNFRRKAPNIFSIFLVIFGAKRRKFANSLKTTGKFVKNTLFLALLFSNFRREAAIFFSNCFQQFWPRSGQFFFSNSFLAIFAAKRRKFFLAIFQKF